MMQCKKNHLKFSMKLLLDGNIVLAEYPGFEPQLFMPVLLDKSIVLQNIIFDNNAPIPHRIRPKLPVLKSSAPSFTAHSNAGNVKMNTRNLSDNLPIGNPPLPGKSDSFRWVRSGCDQKLNRLKDTSSAVMGPSTDNIPTKSRFQKNLPKLGARELSTFDTVRSLFYGNRKSTQSPQSPPSKTKKIGDDNKLKAKKSRVNPSVRRHSKAARALCGT